MQTFRDYCFNFMKILTMLKNKYNVPLIFIFVYYIKSFIMYMYM